MLVETTAAGIPRDLHGFELRSLWDSRLHGRVHRRTRRGWTKGHRGQLATWGVRAWVWLAQQPVGLTRAAKRKSWRYLLLGNRRDGLRTGEEGRRTDEKGGVVSFVRQRQREHVLSCKIFLHYISAHLSVLERCNRCKGRTTGPGREAEETSAKVGCGKLFGA